MVPTRLETSIVAIVTIAFVSCSTSAQAKTTIETSSSATPDVVYVEGDIEGEPSRMAPTKADVSAGTSSAHVQKISEMLGDAVAIQIPRDRIPSARDRLALSIAESKPRESEVFEPLMRPCRSIFSLISSMYLALID